MSLLEDINIFTKIPFSDLCITTGNFWRVIIPIIKRNFCNLSIVRNCNGKAILHESFADAEKLAIETYKKFEKFNKSFEG